MEDIDKKLSLEDAEALKKAKFQALKLLNIKPRTVAELSSRLTQKGFSTKITDTVIKEFKNKGLLNDHKFSKLWIENRLLNKPKGFSVLKKELKKKGVPEEDIQVAIDSVKEEYEEYAVAKSLAEKRLSRMGGLKIETKRRRLYGFLQRRGFSAEIISNLIRELLQ